MDEHKGQSPEQQAKQQMQNAGGTAVNAGRTAVDAGREGVNTAKRLIRRPQNNKTFGEKAEHAGQQLRKVSSKVDEKIKPAMKKAGGEIGKGAGKAGGALTGGLGGAVSGAAAGALAGGVGAIPGAIKGLKAGAKAGSKVGGKVGEKAGKRIGAVASKAPGGILKGAGSAIGTSGHLVNKLKSTGLGKKASMFSGKAIPNIVENTRDPLRFIKNVLLKSKFIKRICIIIIFLLSFLAFFFAGIGYMQRAGLAVMAEFVDTVVQTESPEIYQQGYMSTSAMTQEDYEKIIKSVKAGKLDDGTKIARAEIPIVGGVAGSVTGVPNYQQGDSLWAGVPVNNGGFTIGGAGCAVTSIADIWSGFSGQKFTPPMVVQVMASNSGSYRYYAQGAAYSCQQTLGLDSVISTDINDAITCLQSGGLVMAKVDNGGGGVFTGGHMHYMCLSGMQGDKFIVNNPNRIFGQSGVEPEPELHTREELIAAQHSERDRYYCFTK